MPLINPIIFYFIEVFSNLAIFFMIAGIAFFIIALCYGMENASSYGGDEKALKSFWKYIAIAGVCTFTSLIIPSERTMYKMLLAQYATKENIVQTTDFVIDTIDKAVDKLLETRDRHNRR